MAVSPGVNDLGWDTVTISESPASRRSPNLAGWPLTAIVGAAALDTPVALALDITPAPHPVTNARSTHATAASLTVLTDALLSGDGGGERCASLRVGLDGPGTQSEVHVES